MTSAEGQRTTSRWARAGSVFPKGRRGASDNGSGTPPPRAADRRGLPLLDPDRTLGNLEGTELKGERRRVGIELRQVTRGVSGGIIVVLVGTLEALFELRPEIDFIVFCSIFSRDLLDVEAPNVELVTLPLVGFFSELDRLAVEHELDAVIRSYPSVEAVAYPLDRQIFVIPDIQHEEHPEFFAPVSLEGRRRAFEPALRGAGAILTISEFARRTIQAHASPGRDVIVASPSLPPEFIAARSAAATDEERALVPAGVEFFLYPANLWPHKNHQRLFDAFGLFRERTGLGVELVLTGSQQGWPELQVAIGNLPVRHLGYVSPELLKLLYERAIALTFFSEYEGFGIPVLEAFSAGTPVVCSNTTSLPEVAGEAALLVDPTDVEAMAAALERIVADAELRSRLSERGRARLADSTWARAGHSLAVGLDRLLDRENSPVGLNPAPAPPRATRAFAGARLRREGEQRGRVWGYWTDNWVGQRLEVAIRSRQQAKSYHLVGQPVCAMTLEVATPDGPLGTFTLEADALTTVVVEVPRGPQQKLTFRFSHSAGDSGGRRLSFRLAGTNLFTETDLVDGR